MTSHHYLHTGQHTCHADDGHEVPCAGSGQDASFGVGTPWQESLDFVANMNREQSFGQRDWRMPNRRELRSLLSMQTSLPALPERHPFINVFNGWYRHKAFPLSFG